MMNVVGAVLIENNKIILPKRSEMLKKMPNKFEFPGGKVEKNETLKEALIRELYEELSIDVDFENISEFPNNVLATEKFMLSIFIVKEWKNEITLNPEINSEIIKVDFDELKNIKDLLETDKQLVPAVLKFITTP